MRVAMSATGDTLDASIDPRFGRCAFLILVDTDTMEVIGGGRNEFAAASGGAGTQTAQQVAQLKAEAVLTGNIGPNAYNVLKAAGVRTFTGVSGPLRQALQDLQEGNLRETSGATAPPHAGMGGR